MPFLEGMASRCTHQEIADDLGITPDLVEWRMRTMDAAGLAARGVVGGPR
jgi:predicted transcriptional regulator